MVTAGGDEPVLLYNKLPHDLRHLLGVLHPAIAWPASDVAAIALYVHVRVHEPAESASGDGRYPRHSREDHCGCLR